MALVYSPCLQPWPHTPAQGEEFLLLSQILREHLLVCMPRPAEVGIAQSNGISINKEKELPVGAWDLSHPSSTNCLILFPLDLDPTAPFSPPIPSLGGR